MDRDKGGVRHKTSPDASRTRLGTVAPMSDRCDSCGDDGPELLTVQRIYVRFDQDNLPAGHTLADEFETWCAVCCTIYPHEAVTPDS